MTFLDLINPKSMTGCNHSRFEAIYHFLTRLYRTPDFVQYKRDVATKGPQKDDICKRPVSHITMKSFAACVRLVIESLHKFCLTLAVFGTFSSDVVFLSVHIVNMLKSVSTACCLNNNMHLEKVTKVPFIRCRTFFVISDDFLGRAELTVDGHVTEGRRTLALIGRPDDARPTFGSLTVEVSVMVTELL